jgi:glycosyltransferase involved in cell wall biosynthesis
MSSSDAVAGDALVIVNRGSIRLPSGDPLDAALPGSEVVVLNLARELSARGVAVSYYGLAAPDARIDGVAIRDPAALAELTDAPGLRILWLRDYAVPDAVFDRFPLSRHVLLSEDSVCDMTVILRTPADVLAARLPSYLDRFAAVVFASRWHLADWRSGFGFQPANAAVIYNLASHVPWRAGPPPAPARRILHTSHPRKALAAVAMVAARLAGHGFVVECTGDPSLYQDPSCRIICPDQAGGWASLGTFADFAAAQSGVLSFRPPASLRAMADLLDGAGILLHPDYTGETGATTVIEALRRGLIPVVSDLGALPELVGQAGIVVAGRAGTEAFADLCAAAILALSEADREDMFRARSMIAPVIDTEPVLAAWLGVLGLVPGPVPANPPDRERAVAEHSPVP